MSDLINEVLSPNATDELKRLALSCAYQLGRREGIKEAQAITFRAIDAMAAKKVSP